MPVSKLNMPVNTGLRTNNRVLFGDAENSPSSNASDINAITLKPDDQVFSRYLVSMQALHEYINRTASSSSTSIFYKESLLSDDVKVRTTISGNDYKSDCSTGVKFDDQFRSLIPRGVAIVIGGICGGDYHGGAGSPLAKNENVSSKAVIAKRQSSASGTIKIPETHTKNNKCDTIKLSVDVSSGTNARDITVTWDKNTSVTGSYSMSDTGILSISGFSKQQKWDPTLKRMIKDGSPTYKFDGSTDLETVVDCCYFMPVSTKGSLHNHVDYGSPRVACYKAAYTNIMDTGYGTVLPQNLRLLDPTSSTRSRIDAGATGAQALANPLSLLTGNAAVVAYDTYYSNKPYSDFCATLGTKVKNSLPINFLRDPDRVDTQGDNVFAFYVNILSGLGYSDTVCGVRCFDTVMLCPDFMIIDASFQTFTLTEILKSIEFLNGPATISLVAGIDSAYVEYVLSPRELLDADCANFYDFRNKFDTLWNTTWQLLDDTTRKTIRDCWCAFFLHTLSMKQISDISIFTGKTLLISNNALAASYGKSKNVGPASQLPLKLWTGSKSRVAEEEPVPQKEKESKTSVGWNAEDGLQFNYDSESVAEDLADFINLFRGGKK